MPQSAFTTYQSQSSLGLSSFGSFTQPPRSSQAWRNATETSCGLHDAQARTPRLHTLRPQFTTAPRHLSLRGTIFVLMPLLCRRFLCSSFPFKHSELLHLCELGSDSNYRRITIQDLTRVVIKELTGCPRTPSRRADQSVPHTAR